MTPAEGAATSGPVARLAVADSRRYTCLEQGSGVPLVLLHGIGSAARSWKHQLDGLAGRLRVIAWDAPGYGGSDAPASATPDAGDYADALHAFLDALGVERCHLVGHSLGCVIAARFARCHPGRVRTLTLASVATGHAQLPAEEREGLREGRLRDLAALGARGMAEKRGPRLLGPAAPPETVRAVIETMALVREDGYPRAVWMLSTADTRADVRALPPALPVQFVFGDADAVTTPKQNWSVARERSDAPVHVLAGAGHALYLEQPQAFNALLLRFVEASP